MEATLAVVIIFAIIYNEMRKRHRLERGDSIDRMVARQKYGEPMQGGPLFNTIGGLVVGVAVIAVFGALLAFLLVLLFS